MTYGFLERSFDPPIGLPEFMQMVARSAGCFDLHTVDWQQSMLSADGRNLICWFSAHDLESIRIALRTAEVDQRVFWSGSVHDAPGIDADGLASANVVVTRQFDESVLLEDIQAIEDAGAGCLEMREVKFIRTFFSADKKRMLCLYQAPDVESVRQAQREAKMPFEKIWSFGTIRPESVLSGA